MSKPRTDRSVQIPNGLIPELLTESELRMVKQRFLILKLLEQNRPIRAVAEAVGVGTDTVMRVSRLADKKPLLKSYFKRVSKTLSGSSKWIFGQAKVEEE